ALALASLLWYESAKPRPSPPVVIHAYVPSIRTAGREQRSGARIRTGRPTDCLRRAPRRYLANLCSRAGIVRRQAYAGNGGSFPAILFMGRRVVGLLCGWQA